MFLQTLTLTASPDLRPSAAGEMVKLFFDSGAAAAETIGQSPPLLTWQDPSAAASAVPDPATLQDTWAGVRGLEEPQRRFLQKLQTKGVKLLAGVRHLYSPDLKAGWGIHVVQDVKLLAKKADRDALDSAIQELVDLGLQRETAAESIYKEWCIGVDDGLSWAKYMSVSGSVDDEFDVIMMQYTEERLLTIDDNRGGHAPAFGDDIAIESLATDFKREIYVVQAHGSDAMVDEDNCVFFLPHRPRSEICGPPFFLFMKGTGWCGAGADHYEPLIAHPLPLVSQEKAAVVL